MAQRSTVQQVAFSAAVTCYTHLCTHCIGGYLCTAAQEAAVLTIVLLGHCAFCNLPPVASLHSSACCRLSLYHATSKWSCCCCQTNQHISCEQYMLNIMCFDAPTVALMVQLELSRNKCRDKRIDVWPRAVDTAVFNPAFRSQAMRERLTEGNPEATILVYVGRLGAGTHVSHVLIGASQCAVRFAA